MEHNDGGLVQTMFLSKTGWCVGSLLVFQGVDPAWRTISLGSFIMKLTWRSELNQGKWEKDELGSDSDILLVVLLMAEMRLTTWDEEKPCK